jgi:hypothetical protein
MPTRKVSRILVLISGLALAGAIFTFKTFDIKYNIRWVTMIIGVMLFTLTILFSLIYIRTKFPSHLKAPTLIAILIMSFFVLIGHIHDFSKYHYSTIPPHLGGGGTKDVQLLLKLEDKEKKFFESSGLKFQGDSNQTETLQLLFANDNEYVFLVKSVQFPDSNGSTLSIKKDLIQAVLYAGSWQYLGSSDL